MIKTLKYFALIFTSGLLMSCGGNKAEEKKAMGPEAVVEAFSRAVAAGDFDHACTLCDTTSMMDYINGYRTEWESLRQKDSSVLAIASSILSEAEITIEKTAKEADGRAIYYTIEAEGKSKTRKAIVRSEEGAWRVTSITDVI